jgi:hypothetical protein
MTGNELHPARRTLVRPPKILPWLARSAGLTMGQAESIWRAAVRNAHATSPQAEGSSGYWRDLLSSAKAGIARAGDKWSTRRQDRDFEAPKPVAFNLFEMQQQLAQAALAAWTAFLETYMLGWPRRRQNCRSTHR